MQQGALEHRWRLRELGVTARCHACMHWRHVAATLRCGGGCSCSQRCRHAVSHTPSPGITALRHPWLQARRQAESQMSLCGTAAVFSTGCH